MQHSILHFITALFHEAKDKFDHHKNRNSRMSGSTEDRGSYDQEK
jgi:hypothetical protein